MYLGCTLARLNSYQKANEVDLPTCTNVECIDIASQKVIFTHLGLGSASSTSSTPLASRRLGLVGMVAWDLAYTQGQP